MRLYCVLILLFGVLQVSAQDFTPYYYSPGSPKLMQLYVDPERGDDNNSGTTNKAPFRSLDAAWRSIPARQSLAEGYQINLAKANYTCDLLPNYMESRYGTYERPIIIRGDSAVLHCGLNIFDCRYLYLYDLIIIDTNATADVLHVDHCDHVLLKNSYLHSSNQTTQECLKLNQSQYCYIEGNDISGAWDNAIDAVAVQFGHVVHNKIHDCGDWAMYLKGGSAYFRVEANEFYDAGTGGFTAGQGTGFQFMTPPWIHYEAYDIKVINNIIHDCSGAALGVHGGYNILMAHNTAYKTGSRSHLFEAGFGERSCDGTDTPGTDHDSCAIFISRGGWGNTRTADGTNFTRIPNKNVYVMNNIFFNPAEYPKGDQFLNIFGAYSGDEQTGSNVAVPTLADNNLVFKGNILYNGGDTMFYLGIGSAESGCGPDNPLCNETQLRKDNYINTLMPELQNPNGKIYYPVKNGTLYSLQPAQIPPFTGTDREGKPATPAGVYDNTLTRDYDQFTRLPRSLIGAYSNDTFTLGIESISVLDGNLTVSLVPNPAAEYLTVTMLSEHSGSERCSIRILSLLGEVIHDVYSGTVEAGRRSWTVSVDTLPVGMYFCMISRGSSSVILPYFIHR